MLNNSGKKTQILGVIFFFVGILASIVFGILFYLRGALVLALLGLGDNIIFIIIGAVLVFLLSVFVFSLLSYMFISIGKTDSNTVEISEKLSKLEKKMLDNNKVETEILTQVQKQAKQSTFVNRKPLIKTENALSAKASEPVKVSPKKKDNTTKKCTLCAKESESLYKIIDKTGTKYVYLCPECYIKWLDKYNMR